MKVLAVVPARGGSKGVRRKNVHPLLGRPLLAYTSACIRESRRITRAVLSSDDAEILAVGRQLGLEAPFVRPVSLAGDDVSSVDVALHALEHVENEEGKIYDAVALLEPTAPLRTGEDIDAALDVLFSSDADSVVGVCRVEAPHPGKMQVIEGGYLKPLMPEIWRDGLRRQNLFPVYFLNGAVYAVRRETLRRTRSFWGPRTLPYVMPPERSLNIDSALDFRIAEALLERSRDGIGEDRALPN